MMQIPVYSMAGEAIEEIELADDIFGIAPNVAVMHQAFERQRANARLGTHKTKKRSDVRGGGRKPWPQKGTGRARQGSIRAPQWKGGGTVFGPQPRSYEQKLNLKMRRLALRSALSVKAADEQIVVVDKLEMPEPKTKEMVALLERLGLDAPTLILLDTPDRNVELSARNLPHVKTLQATYLSVRDLLRFDLVLMSRDALEVIEGTFGAL
ncbi:MAG: 50S ribosomal protein L4 [Anaerolineae bacterium]